MKGLLEVNKTKIYVSLFVQVFFLQLSQYEDKISGAKVCHKTNLHLTF